jgi:aminoglycoside phosphotransferase (APT) family kinase protein
MAARPMSRAAQLVPILRRLALAAPDEVPPMLPLNGGVSSEVLRVELRTGPVCVKRALPRLKVVQDWRAPVERNAYEALWLRTVQRLFPESVPAILGEDREAGLFVMSYLPAERFAVWKQQLRDGVTTPAVAGAVGALMAAIHARTAFDRAIEAAFAGAAPIFHALRLDPYFAAAARVNPTCAGRLTEVAERTAAMRTALVHGDCSPKNILIGPQGPVLLDAEACCFGDPAFDLAFCLSHLLLKCFWVPALGPDYLACFDALSRSYLDSVSWEPRADLEARAGALLPALVLARIDGKSPVEYITSDADKCAIRSCASAAMLSPAASLYALKESWSKAR